MTEQEQTVARCAATLLVGRSAVATRNDISLAVSLAWQIVNEVRHTTVKYSEE